MASPMTRGSTIAASINVPPRRSFRGCMLLSSLALNLMVDPLLHNQNFMLHVHGCAERTGVVAVFHAIPGSDIEAGGAGGDGEGLGGAAVGAVADEERGFERQVRKCILVHHRALCPIDSRRRG